MLPSLYCRILLGEEKGRFTLLGVHKVLRDDYSAFNRAVSVQSVPSVPKSRRPILCQAKQARLGGQMEFEGHTHSLNCLAVQRGCEIILLYSQTVVMQSLCWLPEMHNNRNTHQSSHARVTCTATPVTKYIYYECILYVVMA
jgi:hypothetical protein